MYVWSVMMKTIAILIFDGIMASGVVGPTDIFNIANSIAKHFDRTNMSDLFEVKFVSLDDCEVTTPNNITFKPTMKLSEIDQADLLLVGGHQYTDEKKLLAHLKYMKDFNPYLQRAHAKGTTICSFCTGSFTLAQAGLLNDSKATVSWWLAQKFNQYFPHVELIMNELVVKNNNVWTCGATTAYTSLCVELVEKYTNHQLASQLSRVMLLDNNRMSQLPYMRAQGALGHNDKAIASCQYWLQERLSQSITIKAMSEQCALSERTLIRRFKAATGVTPLSYLQQLRVDAAKQLLENTNLTLENIVTQVGYDDVSAFRRLFTKLTQLTPRAYRSSFG